MNIVPPEFVQMSMRPKEMHLPTPEPEHPYQGEGRYRFPVLEGTNLLGDRITLPPVALQSFHIMLVVFHPEALYGINAWLPVSEDLRKQYQHTPTPVEYGVVLILQPPPLDGDFPAFTQALGDITEFHVMMNSVLAYADQPYVRSRLSLHRKAKTAVLLLDGNGNILWKEDGEFTPGRAEEVESILHALTPLAPKMRRH